MKLARNVLLFTLALSCINFIISGKANTLLKRGEDGRNMDALTYSDGKQETGLSFGLGSNGGYSIANERDFRSVTQGKITGDNKIPTGPKERADEVPSVDTYYDGELHLNAVKVNCRVYRNINTCTLSNQCGWCHANGMCIAGNSLGPLEECPRSKYQFSWPQAAEQGQRVTNQDHGDLLIRTIQRKPNI